MLPFCGQTKDPSLTVIIQHHLSTPQHSSEGNKSCSSHFTGNFWAMHTLEPLNECRFHSMWQCTWLFVNSWVRKSPIPTAAEFLNSCHDGINISVCSGIMLKNLLCTWVYCCLLFYLLTPKCKVGHV